MEWPGINPGPYGRRPGTSKSPLISVFRSLVSVQRTPHGDHDRNGQTDDSSRVPEVMAVLDTVTDYVSEFLGLGLGSLQRVRKILILNL